MILPLGRGASAAATLGALDETMRILLDSTVLIDYLRGRPGQWSA